MTDPRKIAEDIEAGGGATVEQRRTLARAYLALLPPAGAWSHDEGDVVLTHPDGSTERFYAGERAPFIVAACSRYEALVSDLPHAVERCACRMASDSAAWRMEPAHRAAIERLRAGVGEAAGGREKGRG